jgi:prepilin-type N-terminal cleavage/methylation domain-containing protein
VITITSSTQTPDIRGVHAHAAAARWRSARGFTLLEILVVATIAAILMGVAIGITPAVVRSMQGDSIAQQLNGFLRQAREQAIARRRNIRVASVGTNRIQSTLVNVAPANTTTPLNSTVLEGGLEFRRFPGQGDTPDAFGAGAANIVFSGPTPHAFTSEGTFVDANGDPSNGTLFIGQPNQPATAAAITIFGPTAAMRTWRWNGRAWVQ